MGRRDPDPTNSLSDSQLAAKMMINEYKLDDEEMHCTPSFGHLTSGNRGYYADKSMGSYILSDFSSALALYAELDLTVVPTTSEWLLNMVLIPSAFLWRLSLLLWKSFPVPDFSKPLQEHPISKVFVEVLPGNDTSVALMHPY